MNATGKNESLGIQRRSNGGVKRMKKGKNTAITQAMAKLEMTQQDLATASGLHLTNINAIVNGSHPKVDNAIRVSRALETTVEKLWGHMVTERTKEDST